MADAAAPQVDTIFLGFNQTLEQDATTREEIRKLVKDLELHVRKMTTVLQQIHSQRQSDCASGLISLTS